MSTIGLVDNELRRFLTDFPIPEMDAEHLAAVRAAPSIPYPESPDIQAIGVAEHYIKCDDGSPDVRVLIYRTTAKDVASPAILHMHGGGMVLGAPEMSDATNRIHAAALGAIIVSVDYRLPPEHPFPAPLEDCYAALKWLHGNASNLGVDRARIAVKGESAGGGLAAGLALLARDRGEVPVTFQCLTYPMIDDRPACEPHPHTGEFVWTSRSNRFGWSCYLGQEPGGEGVSPYAAPARAVDLSGLPPALIIAASLDLFLEENLEYARRLLRAGVPVEVIVYPGAYHGFPMAGATALNRRYERDIREALVNALSKKHAQKD
ncbi:alpha/beta hydrolase [Novosphingobium sp. G106]|uniref:alpha/beta hydrolase n=1 Tax=Novosphingobium sp. G106 TaxID=2849500 RepID=UPI0020C52C87|nr:alpha/beta hydrolase [Novosphingobium sp. G106]